MLMDSVPVKIRAFVGFHKKSPGIFKSAGFDENNLRYAERLKIEGHGIRYLPFTLF
jgi:hypothetical protein